MLYVGLIKCSPCLETYYLQQNIQFQGSSGNLLITNPLLTKIMYRKLLPFNEYKRLLNYMTTVGCLKEGHQCTLLIAQIYTQRKFHSQVLLNLMKIYAASHME